MHDNGHRTPWSNKCSIKECLGVGLFVKRQASVRSFQSLTLVGLAVMAIAVIGFGANIGIVSISVGIVLAVIDPKAARAALTKVSWSVVVLITGVLAYIYILEQAGTVAWVSDGIMSLGVPLLAALLLFYLAGFVSALASSLGIIGVVIGLAWLVLAVPTWLG